MFQGETTMKNKWLKIILSIYLGFTVATYGYAYNYWKKEAVKKFDQCLERFEAMKDANNYACEVARNWDDGGSSALFSSVVWPIFLSIVYFDEGERK